METRAINMFRDATLNIGGRLIATEIRDGVEHSVVDFPGFASIALPSEMFKTGLTGSVSIIKQEEPGIQHEPMAGSSSEPKKTPWYKFSGLF